jgi:hypothetical protein
MLLSSVIAGAPAPVRGDFDHDGRSDVAQIIASNDGKYRLVVRHGDVRRSTSVIQVFERSALPNLYVGRAKPGRWKTWCGKGGGNEGDPCPRESVVLHGDTLDFGMSEASESVAIWNGRSFDVVLLSD